MHTNNNLMNDTKKAKCDCGEEFDWYFKTSPKMCFQCKGRQAVKVNQDLHKRMFNN